MNRVKKDRFYQIYFTVIGVFAVLLAFGLTVYGFFLQDYEMALPEKAASYVFSECFENPDNGEALFNRLDGEISEFEGVSEYLEYLEAKKNENPFTFRAKSSGLGDGRSYLVASGKSKIGEFTLVPSGEKTKFGFDCWKLGEMTTYADREYAAVVRVLPESKLYVNGEIAGDGYIAKTEEPYNVFAISGMLREPKLSVKSENGRESLIERDGESGEYKEDYRIVKAFSTSTIYADKAEETAPFIIEKSIPCEYSEHMPDGVQELSYTKYRITGLSGVTQLRAEDINGNEAVLVEDEDGVLCEEPVYSEELEKDYSDLAVNAAKTYAKYMTKDSSLNELAKYFDNTSKIFRYIRTSEVVWYTTHIGYTFEDEKASEFFKLSDGAFACRYTGKQTVNRTATDKRVINLDLTLYFKKSGKSYIVYDLVTNG